MDLNDFLASSQERVDGWFKNDEAFSITGNLELLIVAAVVFFLGVIIGYWSRRDRVSSPLLEMTGSTKTEVDNSNSAFVQLLLVESKLLFERYQSDTATLINTSSDDLSRLHCSISAADLFVYNTGIEDVKALKNSALRQQIVKANTQFKMALASVELCRKYNLEYIALSKIAASSQKPLDENAAAIARLALQKQRQSFIQEHQQTSAQMQQMFSMIRSVRQSS